MADEKDRFGDKLREKEKAEEDRFFQRKDEQALERLRNARAAAKPGVAADCPRDGTTLTAVDHSGVAVLECPNCHGMWLDPGELEIIAKREKDSWLSRIFYRPRL